MYKTKTIPVLLRSSLVVPLVRYTLTDGLELLLLIGFQGRATFHRTAHASRIAFPALYIVALRAKGQARSNQGKGPIASVLSAHNVPTLFALKSL